MEENCIRCNRKDELGTVTNLCSLCWWEVASWSSTRKGKLEKEYYDKLLREKYKYGIRDLRDRI